MIGWFGSFIVDLFREDFMLRALLSGLMLGILAPLIGSIVVVRRLSFIADTLGHFSLVGISVSLFLSVTLPRSLAVIFSENPQYLGIFSPSSGDCSSNCSGDITRVIKKYRCPSSSVSEPP
jgi:zinc transport system permease protein